MFWIRMNLQRFQPSNGKCSIRMFLFYLIKKYVSYNFSYAALVLYVRIRMYTKASEKDHFTIITSSHFIKRIIFALYVL